MQPPPKENQIQSVGQLTSGIKLLLEDSYPAIWVKGEISNLKYQSSGHIYFSLKDDRAQISAVMFRGNASHLSVRLKDGMEIIAFGNVGVYEPRGSYQLIVRQCIEEGVGQLQAEFERLKRKLNEEGLFSAERKKPLPILARKIGIITSPTGAALRDFLSILNRRNWKGEVIIFPALVQGAEGAPDILKKLKWAVEYGDLDLLVIGRGGGSIEDLWNFNEEEVVRAIAACPIPVISAVGHEIDFVLTDFVADKRAETPSAAAELITSGYLDALNRLDLSRQHLVRALRDQTQQKEQLVDRISDKLKGLSPTRLIENRHIRMDELQQRLRSRIHEVHQRCSNNLALLDQRYKTLHPRQIIMSQNEILQHLKNRLCRDVSYGLTLSQNEVASLGKRLSSLGVAQVLKRGYTITRDKQENILTSAQPLKHGQLIEIQFNDGKRTAIVQTKKQLDMFHSLDNS